MCLNSSGLVATTNNATAVRWYKNGIFHSFSNKVVTGAISLEISMFSPGFDSQGIIRGERAITNNLRGIRNAWHFCFYFNFSVYGTMS